MMQYGFVRILKKKSAFGEFSLVSYEIHHDIYAWADSHDTFCFRDVRRGKEKRCILGARYE